MPAPLLPGALPERISRYRVEGLAGTGGMSVVLRATDTVLERPVALKVLGTSADLDVTARARLLREARHLASLQHPNVVAVYDSGEADGVVFLALRWVEGPDLGAVVRDEGPLDPARAVALVEEIAAALDAAHAAGLVHRDVKPSNVLLCAEDGHALLTDFGLTTGAETSRELTATGEVVGTPDYVAPEQVDGRPVDHRADVYGLGGLALFLLTGEVPYPREGGMAKLFAHVSEAPPSLRERRADVPRALDDAIARAMAKDPAERFASAGAFAAAARAALGVDAPAAAVQPATAVHAALAPSAAAPERAAAASAGPRRSPRALAAIALAVALGGAGAALAIAPPAGDGRTGAPSAGAARDRAISGADGSGTTATSAEAAAVIAAPRRARDGERRPKRRRARRDGAERVAGATELPVVDPSSDGVTGSTTAPGGGTATAQGSPPARTTTSAQPAPATTTSEAPPSGPTTTGTATSEQPPPSDTTTSGQSPPPGTTTSEQPPPPGTTTSEAPPPPNGG